MSTEAVDPQTDVRQLKRAAIAAGIFVVVLWLIMAIDGLTGADLTAYGVFPRMLVSVPGIALAPLIHGSYTHLLMNTPPLLVLGTATLYSYPRAARIMLPIIYFGTGMAVWLFARPAYHIGASGLTHGLLFFLLIAGMLRKDRRSMGLAMVVLFLYGSMIWGILPADPTISFESHLAGATLGTITAIALRDRDPAPPRRRYSWEDGAQDDEEPWIDPLWQDTEADEQPPSQDPTALRADPKHRLRK